MNLIDGYELREMLHQGARSVVYRARRARDGAAVVIKAPAKEFPSAAEIGRLRREHDILASLKVPGVIGALDLEEARSRVALLMEDVGAVSLATRLAKRGRLDVRDALACARSIATTLGEVHRRGVIHRDIKPANVVATADMSEVLIIDFGLATRLSRESVEPKGPNVLVGTLRYISPEQTGRVNRPVDYRTDYYSLGATLYELLTGEPPFVSNDPVELVHRHIAREPVSPSEIRPEIPEAVSAVVLKLLAKTAEARYQSAAGIVADLEECFARLAGRGREGPFVPGEHDLPERFQEPQRLYGREGDVAALLAAFERVAHGGVELLLVAGYSGVGKSAVVHDVQKPVLERRGFFITGKFEELKRDIPYASIIEAFQDIVQRLLAEQEDALAAWRRRIQEAVGANGGVITAVIPDVALIIGPQPPVPALPPVEAQNRFNFVLQSFVRAFAAEDHPLVVFLDDLQWADAPSLKLLQLLATDPGSRHLLLIGAYRDNEVNDAHPLPLAIESMTKGGAKVTTVSLSALGPEHVEELIADSLRKPRAECSSLAALCLDKTRGNPFFLNQFLRSLFDEGLIALDAAARGFRWDTEEIRRLSITDNVVDLMVGKIQKLPAPTQRILKPAACIGNRFELGTLAIVSELTKKEVAQDLWRALVEGLVLPTQGGHELAEPSGQGWAAAEDIPDVGYRFLHDRVQQAVYSVIPSSDRAEVHLTVGRLLHRSASGEALEEHLFDVVNQLNLGLSRVTSTEERVALAHLNLRAGRKAKASVAYDPALRYLETGLSLLPEGSFRDRHDLAFALHAEAMESAYQTGRLDRAKELAEAAMAEATSVLEKVKILETRMLDHTARNEIAETVSTAHEALALLDEALPPVDTVDVPKMLEAIGETARRLGARRAADLLDLPEMTDPHKIAALRIMVTAGPPTYIASPLSFPVLACAMVNLCLQHGNCAHSAYTYSAYGLLLPDVALKNEYGDLAVGILDRYDGRDRGKILTMLAIFLRHWKNHVREGLSSLTEAVSLALEVGDLEFVGYASMHYAKDVFYAGEPLPAVEQSVLRYIALMRQLKQEFSRLYLAITQQAAENLMGGAADPLKFKGSAFDEDIELPALVEAKNIPSLHLFWIDKAIVAYALGAFAEARTATVRAAEHVGGHLGMSPVALQSFYDSLTRLALLDGADEEARREALAAVEKNQAEMKAWANDGPANYMHKYLLVEAERARVTGRGEEAMGFYDQAIRSASEHLYVNEEAIACERCASFHFAARRARIGRTYLAEARHAYERWGATAKVDKLDREHPWLATYDDGRDRAPMLSTVGSSEGSGTAIDLATVMKAARAISGEIVLSRLVDAVMRSVVESAGAQRGVLLLEREGALAVEATYGGGEELCESIRNYVTRTGETVILGDAAALGQFTADPYVVANKPRSVLAAPLINQGKRVALIYLENNLTSDAFTADRLEVIRMLLAQAALSIQNAQLYESLTASKKKLEEYNESLEQNVAERTRELVEKNGALSQALAELRATQAQLVTQEKLASLGALTAGIAHEIKNPLNFVTNFASLSVGFVDEIAEIVEEQVREGDARAEVASVLDELRQSVSRVNEHGKRANGIVDAMLLHVRQGGAVREQTDINALASQGAELALHGLRARDPGVELRVEKDLDPSIGTIEMVTSDMSRVFVNILNNAWYATLEKRRKEGPSYTPKVTLTTRGLGDRVEVRIRDNGTGIPAGVQDKIWHPFFTTKPSGDGTGLGLSISYDIVTKGHMGQIEVESVPGEGAEFIIRLPRHPRPPEEGKA